MSKVISCWFTERTHRAKLSGNKWKDHHNLTHKLDLAVLSRTVRLHVCLFDLFTYLPTYPWTSLTSFRSRINEFVCASICLSVCGSASLFVCRCVYLLYSPWFICSSACGLFLSVLLQVCPHVSQFSVSFSLSVILSIYIASVSFFTCISACLPACLPA